MGSATIAGIPPGRPDDTHSIREPLCRFTWSANWVRSFNEWHDTERPVFIAGRGLFPCMQQTRQVALAEHKGYSWFLCQFSIVGKLLLSRLIGFLCIAVRLGVPSLLAACSLHRECEDGTKDDSE